METQCGAVTNIIPFYPSARWIRLSLYSFQGKTKSTLCHRKVDLTHILAQWGVSLDSFSPKILNGSHSLLFGVGGGKLTTCLYSLICISIALLSFERFVFKHEVCLCKHTQTCMCTQSHTYRCTSKHDYLALCSACFQACWYNYPLVSGSSGFNTLHKY